MSEGKKFTALVDWFPILISTAALVASVISLVVSLIDRNENIAEMRPVIGHEYVGPRISKPYGFFIENRGERRARVKFIELQYTDNGKDKPVALKFLEASGVKIEDAFSLKIGPNFTMAPSQRRPLFTFSEDLNEERGLVFEQYVVRLRADICYCNSSQSSCWIHTVTATRAEAEIGPITQRSCGR